MREDGGVIIPVTVVTGFLGAGKSTLVEGWLSALPRDETAVTELESLLFALNIFRGDF